MSGHWSSLNFLYVGERKEEQVSLRLYIARGKKGDHSCSKFWEERQPLDLRPTVR